jgi:hypothetical protein
MKLICDNYDSGKCNYSEFKFLEGADMPTAMDKETGFCMIWKGKTHGDWLLKGSMDCDMLDLEGREI